MTRATDKKELVSLLTDFYSSKDKSHKIELLEKSLVIYITKLYEDIYEKSGGILVNNKNYELYLQKESILKHMNKIFKNLNININANWDSDLETLGAELYLAIVNKINKN